MNVENNFRAPQKSISEMLFHELNHPKRQQKFPVKRYVKKLYRFQPAESAKLLIDGKGTYPEMLNAIASAQTRVDLETYILYDDQTGKKFQLVLRQASKRGVFVRLLYDYIGCFGISDRFVREMIDDGVDVRVYHPLLLSRPIWAINHRDHRKILIVDRTITFTGGINIGDDYAPEEEGGRGWRDTNIRIDGSAVGEWAEQLFNYAWQKSTPYSQTLRRRDQLRGGLQRRFKKPITFRDHLHKTITSPITLKDVVPVQMVSSREFRRRREIRSAYLHAINKARNYILIENAYFIPDAGIRRALKRAVRRGVFVGIVLAGNSDIPIARHAGQYLYAGLLAAGIRLFEWSKSMMHAKTCVIDDAWSVVGSYNLDHRSLLHQLEIVAVVADHPFSRKLREQTLSDIAQCQEILLANHNRRSWLTRLLDMSAYLLHHWL